jgi:hypothetical protein
MVNAGLLIWFGDEYHRREMSRGGRTVRGLRVILAKTSLGMLTNVLSRVGGDFTCDVFK